MTKEQKKFEKWTKSKSRGRGLLCHFYKRDKDFKYYGEIEFVYFNLYLSSRNWVIKGTKGHGISNQGIKSQIPCLNCYKIDNEFRYKVNSLQIFSKDSFEFGLILDKRQISKILKK